jgi:integrase
MLRQLLSQCCHGKQPSDGVLTRDDGSQVLYPQRAWHRLCVATNLGTFICRSCHQPSHQQGRCSKCNVNDWGYKGLLVHDLRRTAARRLIRAGVSEVVAMQITGHKTRSMFQRYNITVMEDKRDAMAKLQRADAKWSRAAQPSKVDGSLTTAAPSKRTTVQ